MFIGVLLIIELQFTQVAHTNTTKLQACTSPYPYNCFNGYCCSLPVCCGTSFCCNNGYKCCSTGCCQSSTTCCGNQCCLSGYTCSGSTCLAPPTFSPTRSPAPAPQPTTLVNCVYYGTYCTTYCSGVCSNGECCQTQESSSSKSSSTCGDGCRVGIVMGVFGSSVLFILMLCNDKTKSYSDKIDNPSSRFDDPQVDCCECGDGCKVFFKSYMILLLGQLITMIGLIIFPGDPKSPSMTYVRLAFTYVEAIIQSYCYSKILYTTMNGLCCFDVCCPICSCCCNTPNIFCMIYGCRCNKNHGHRYKWSIMLTGIHSLPIELTEIAIVSTAFTPISLITIIGASLKILYKVYSANEKSKKVKKIFSDGCVDVPANLNLMTGLYDTLQLELASSASGLSPKPISSIREQTTVNQGNSMNVMTSDKEGEGQRRISVPIINHSLDSIGQTAMSHKPNSQSVGLTFNQKVYQVQCVSCNTTNMINHMSSFRCFRCGIINE